MADTAEELYKQGLERYQAGEGADTLIPLFKEITAKSPKNSSAWISLGWLYLLNDKPKSAYKAAKMGVKLNKDDPQARINLALAMLELEEKGVRSHIDRAMQMIMVDSEWRDEIKSNIDEGFKRKPDWKSLTRVKNWLFEV
ncbi:MAG: hypothetical protein SXA11_09105 [Cyanobacteriota bacterium]|nr:hypothetical protein [Cyanobacteriota bacterium]